MKGRRSGRRLNAPQVLSLWEAAKWEVQPSSVFWPIKAITRMNATAM